MIYRTDKDIERIKQTDKPQRIRIDSNLYLNVTQKSSPLVKNWYIRARHNKKTIYEFIGTFDPKHKNYTDSKHVSLSTAKDLVAKKFEKQDREARIAKIKAEEGNPLFSEMCDEWYNTYTKKFRTSTYTNAKKIVDKYIATASFYHKRLSDIKRLEIRNLVVAMPNASATKCLTYIRHIFIFAEKNGFYVVPDYYYGRKADAEVPTAYDLDIPSKSKIHFSALIKPTDFATLIKRIREYAKNENIMSPQYITSRAILFLAYNFCRGSEMLNLQWKDIEYDFSNIATLQPEKVKHKEELIIPFSQQTKELLLDIYKCRIIRDDRKPQADDFVFHKRNNYHSHITSEGLSKFLRKLGYGSNIHCLHGFRSSASTFIREYFPEIRPDIIELQLGHKVGTEIERIYNRSQLIGMRKEMLQKYSDFIDKIVANLDKPDSERYSYQLAEGDPSKIKRVDILTQEETLMTRDELEYTDKTVDSENP